VQTHPETAANVACWSCSAGIAPADKFCRHCGNGQGAHIPWYYRPLGLGFLALFGLGPFVLPMVWRSPVLSRNSKLFATALVALFTVWMGWQVVTLMRNVSSALSGNLAGLQLQ